MNNSQATTAGSSPNLARHPRPRTVTKSVAQPQTRSETLELRDLLEANLHALDALHEEHRRMVDLTLRTVDGACAELRTDLRAMTSARAPWVRALAETRALLYVALRELIVGTQEAELSMHLPQQELQDPHHRLR
ncbi:MAG: hypothetical protein H7138_11075 [Myxococcales bacterium]|nr:hypothetical protein [Myxococcales bacterium]